MRKDYKTIKELVGPPLMVDCVENVKYDELVEIHEKDGRVRLGKVLEAKDNIALVQLFESADGLQISESKARFLGHGLELSVSPEIIGRVFDGIGRPISEVSHRSARYAQLAGVDEETTVTPEIAARVFNAENYGDRVYINKVESAADYEAAQTMAREFSCPVIAGSLHQGVYVCLH